MLGGESGVVVGCGLSPGNFLEGSSDIDITQGTSLATGPTLKFLEAQVYNFDV